MKKKWSKGKTLLAVVAACVLCWGAWRMLFGYEVIRFDPDVMGVVDVIVVDHHGKDDTLHYYNIGTGRVRQECEPFEPEKMTVINIFPGSLDEHARKDGHRAYYQPGEIRVYDAEGRLTENTDPLLEKVLRQMETREFHDVMALQLLQTCGEAFLCTELNVNLWSPYELYWYDQQNDRLIELYTFDGLEVVGLRIRALDRAR